MDPVLRISRFTDRSTNYNTNYKCITGPLIEVPFLAPLSTLVPRSQGIQPTDLDPTQMSPILYHYLRTLTLSNRFFHVRIVLPTWPHSIAYHHITAALSLPDPKRTRFLPNGLQCQFHLTNKPNLFDFGPTYDPGQRRRRREAAWVSSLYHLYPPPTSAARGAGFVVFWDWGSGEVVRRFQKRKR